MNRAIVVRSQYAPLAESRSRCCRDIVARTPQREQSVSMLAERYEQSWHGRAIRIGELLADTPKRKNSDCRQLSHKDVENLTLTPTAEFDANVDRVWQVWEDPRQLERWWGPPTVPATFDRLEFQPSGDARYSMTLPEGQRAYGWWTVIAVDAPNRLEFDEGFVRDDREPAWKRDCERRWGRSTRFSTMHPFAGSFVCTLLFSS